MDKIDSLNAASYLHCNPTLADENKLLLGATVTVTHSHLLSWQQSSDAITNENCLHTFNGLIYSDENSVCIPHLECAEDSLSQVDIIKINVNT